MKLFSSHFFSRRWTLTESFLLFSLVIVIAWVFANCRRSIEPLRLIEEISTTDSVSFIVLGDWGRYGNEDQTAVAKQMFRQGRKHNVQFVITTGDNFYPAGVRDINDSHWRLSYENVYLKDSLPVKWYPVLGNHDYSLNAQAEVEYSSVNFRWNMPGRYYSLKRKLSGTDSILFVFTDSSPFISAYHNVTNTLGDVRTQDTAAQMAWLQSTLRTSKDGWKLVIGHHPVYSVGAHGNTPEMIKQFKPILVKNNVDFYLAGHDHDLQFIKQPNEKVNYLVSGAGSEIRPVNPDANTLFARSSLGFSIVTLYTTKAQVYFYDKGGVLLYQHVVNK